MAKSIASRFKGAVVGAVLGDCLGANFEGMWTVEVKKVVDFFSFIHDSSSTDTTHKGSSDGQEGPKEPTGNSSEYDFTDDTAMARSVAYSLISKSSVDTKDLAKRFTTEYRKEQWRGYGANVGDVFMSLEKEDYADPFGPASRQFEGSGSYGNGGAMRIVPAALYGYDMERSKLLEAVDNITRVTHTHKEALDGAKLQCSAVHVALHHDSDKPLDPQVFLDELIGIMSDLEKECDQNEVKSPAAKKRNVDKKRLSYCAKLKLMKTYLQSEKQVSRAEIQEKLGNDVSALGSVPAAIYSFLLATKPISDVPMDSPYERTITYAVTLGGDTDTIATMAGAIAGAYFGLEEIPQHWQNVCEGVSDAIDYGSQLYGLFSKSSTPVS